MTDSNTPLTKTTDAPDHDAMPAPGEEYDKIIWVPPSSLTIGPNVRQEDATPDQDQIRDYKLHGVEDPITAYRDEAGNLVVVDGQLRVLGSIEAKVEQVPVWVQPPPVEDEKAATIDRISKQIRLNRHRRKMTRGDEFRAFQQLAMLDMSPTAIGRKLSIKKREVEASLQVGKSELAAKAADKYDLTLDQAAVIAEFEDHGDVDTAKELILTAVERPNNFKALAQRKRNDRAEAERRSESLAACTEKLAAAGTVILDDSISAWTGDARSLDQLRPTPEHDPGAEVTPEDHADCPGHGAWIRFDFDDDENEIAVPHFGCSDFRAHGHALIDAPAGQIGYGGADWSDAATPASTEQMAAANLQRQKARIERKWVINNNKHADAALPDRHEWLAGFSRRSSLPKGSRRWLALRTLDGTHTLRKAMERGHKLAHRLLGLPEPTPIWYAMSKESGHERGELYDRISNASDSKAAVYELYLMLCAYEEGFSRDSWRNPTELDQLYMTMAIDLGYKAPDIDLKVLNPESVDDVIAMALGADPDDTGTPIGDNAGIATDVNPSEHDGEPTETDLAA